MNTIINDQKQRAASPLLLVGVFVSTLISSATVQAMPGITAADDLPASLQAPATAAFAEFEPLYIRHCAACHGDKGDGNSRAQRGLKPPPRDFTTASAWAELDRDRMINSVTHGRPNTAMVGWKGRLDEAQIAGVVDYVRASFMSAPASASAAVASSNVAGSASANLDASVSAPPVAALNTSKRAGNSGRDIYKRNCSACHGDKGNGSTWTQNGLNPPPRDFTSDEARQLLNRERMITSVTYGREGTAMMPFNSRLSAEEILTVVDYIRGDFMRVPGVAVSAGTADASSGRANPHSAAPHVRNHVPNHPGRDATAGAMPLTAGQHQPPASHVSPPPPPPKLATSDMSLQLPHGLVGDVTAGRTFYMANCFTCHGVRGDGHGPRSSFITPRPRNFLGERARNTLNRPALFRAISLGLPGTVMPAWSKVLDNQQIADVTEFVFQTFIQRDKAASPANASTMESQAVPGKLLASPEVSAEPAAAAVEKSAAINTTQAPASPLTAE